MALAWPMMASVDHYAHRVLSLPRCARGGVSERTSPMQFPCVTLSSFVVSGGWVQEMDGGR